MVKGEDNIGLQPPEPSLICTQTLLKMNFVIEPELQGEAYYSGKLVTGWYSLPDATKVG